MPHSRRTSAFTLIELLTVIAIIGVLAAILIPTVGKVRDSARQSTTVSNLRQLQMASLAYSSDNKGFFVPIRLGVFSWPATGFTGQPPPPPNALNRWITSDLFLAYFGIRGTNTMDGSQPVSYVPAALTGSKVSILNGSVLYENGRMGIGINKTDLTFSSLGLGLNGRFSYKESELKTASRLIAFAEANDWMVAHTFGGTNLIDRWRPEYDQGATHPNVDAPAFRANGKLLAVTYAGGVVSLSREQAAEWERWSNR